MSEIMKIRVYYFSATGNTKFGLLLLQKNLREQGHSCELIPVENAAGIEGDCDLSGFATPVYGGYPSEIMMDFINRLPKIEEEKPAFTVLCPCSDVGYWGSRELLADLLKSKNFQVIGELGFLGNPSHPTVVGSLELSSPGLRAFFNGIGRPNSVDEQNIKEFAKTLTDTYRDHRSGGKIKRMKHSSLRVRASKKVRQKEIMFQQEHPILLDAEKCTRCGLCQRSCPVQAISMDPYPERDAAKCFNCQKCTNLCPQHAFYLKDIEHIGLYKGAFDKIRKLEKEGITSCAKPNRDPFLLKFLSTGVGMLFLLRLQKITDRKLIRAKRADPGIPKGAGL